MLSVSDLSCSRGDRQLFSGVHLTLKSGCCVHIEGDNGVGKTSLLRIVCGLSPAHEGQVLWGGRAVREVAADFRSHLLYLGHGLSLKEELSALENLQADAAVAGRALSAAQAMAALAQQGLKGREHLPLRVLSQGQKRRTALARLQAGNASLWVLDEPFVALDVRAVESLRQVLSQHVAQGGMVLFTSHQPVPLQGSGHSYRLQR
jgi:heme exporter protein A